MYSHEVRREHFLQREPAVSTQLTHIDRMTACRTLNIIIIITSEASSHSSLRGNLLSRENEAEPFNEIDTLRYDPLGLSHGGIAQRHSDANRALSVSPTIMKSVKRPVLLEKVLLEGSMGSLLPWLAQSCSRVIESIRGSSIDADSYDLLDIE